MADVVGLMLASAIVRQVVTKLGSAIEGQVTMLSSFTDDMVAMRESLVSIAAVLTDAEKRSIKEESVRLWLKRLKKAALDISDILDEFQAESKPTKGKIMGTFSCLTIAPKIISMSKKIKKINEDLTKIKEDHLNFNFASYHRMVMDNENQFPDRETTSKVNEAAILGREKERKRVIDMLSASKSNEHIVILPIVGIGGIGKTTLAQLVFNDDNFKSYDNRIWVYVSQVFDLRKIGNTIISQVLKEERLNGDNREIINQRLQDLLHDKKTLIILDDLWETDHSQLNELKLMLNVSSRMEVLVTTRDEEVAKRISTIAPHRISHLNNSICWDIIKQNSNFELRPHKQQFEKIGQAIAAKCGGVALAARALGFVLSVMNLEQWKEVSKSNIWDDPSTENTVLPSLKLTYIAMPPYLRLCFAHCAIFPRGHNIAKDVLIHQWVALDFIEPSNTISCKQLGEKYLRQLLGMSFLQHSKLPMSAQKSSMLTMHDLVYDLAKSVMGEELIVYNADKTTSVADQKYCRYALLTNFRDPVKISTILPAKIRALFFQDCSKLGLRGSAFSFPKCLRVLDLTESSISMFPASIGYLKQLRFLIAPEMKNQRFPGSITGLSKLQYLNLSGSYRILPASIGELGCLMHLDLSGSTELVTLPKSLRNLKNLLHLDLSSCYRLDGLPEGTCDLTCLQYLNLAACSNVQRLPQDLDSLVKLQYFSLSGCTNIEELPVSFGKLTNLVHLDLSHNDFGVLPESIGNLKRLHTLNLSGCRCLNSLPKSIGSIDSLELLLVNECSESLKGYIRRSGLKCNPLAHFRVYTTDGDSGSNLHQLEGTNPSELEISSLQNVRNTGEANGIELCNKENLSKLTLRWTRNRHRVLEDKDVLGELVPPNGLKYLGLNGYSSISFPNWFMVISHHLPNLVYVKLQNLPRCSSLPPLGQLPNLKELFLESLSNIKKVGEDFCGGKRAFHQLSTFTLHSMDGLEEWNTTYCGEDGTSKFMFPVLDVLVIHGCPRLRLKPCPPIFRRWEISHSDEVLNSGEEGDNFSHFNSAPRTRLKVNSHGYRGRWSLLVHLPTLQELEIIDMNSFPENIRQLASLQFLELCNCSISKLPEWLGVLKSLISLRIVDNTWGWQLKSLPSSIQQLTKLQELYIEGNYELRQWCESEENKMKLAHINNISYHGIYDGEPTTTLLPDAS